MVTLSKVNWDGDLAGVRWGGGWKIGGQAGTGGIRVFMGELGGR